MDRSSDTSNDFSRSFAEYDSSGLEDSSTDKFDCKLEHPMTQTINAVMSNKATSNSTLKSAQNIVKLINEIPGSPINLPTSVNFLKKSATMRFKREYYLFCDGCNELCDKKNYCVECKIITKKTKSNFLVYIPLEQQIKNTLDQHFDEIINYINRIRCDEITDIDDGKLLKHLRQKHPNSIVLGFTLNTDGAQLHNSQKNDVWPVQLYQTFLPPHLRFKSENIIVTTLFFGRTKPDVAKLLYHLSKELIKLTEERTSFYRSGSIYHCLPTIVNCSADLPARAMLSGLKLFNGTYSCILCFHPGMSITDHLKKKYIRYVKLNTTPPERTHKSVINAVEKMSLKRLPKIKPIEGLMKIPPMILFDGFDLSKGFTIDYMHNGLLGIMKLLLDFWLGSHRLCNKSPYFKPLTTDQRKRLNDRLLALKPYERITRKPTSILDRAFYKAIEYKQLLLFYLPVGLEGLMEPKKLEHFKLFSAAVYKLLQVKISSEELNGAHEMLVQFADDFETIYGSEAITMNIHLLKHYRENVLNHGPLWAHSMFGFEQNIGSITKCSKNIPTDDIEVMSLNYCLWRPPKMEQVGEFQLMRGKLVEMPQDIAAALHQQNIKSTIGNQFFAGDAVNYKTQHYKSRKSNVTKSIDYFIEMINGEIGSAHIYVEYKNKIYVVLEKYEVIEIVYHLKKVKPSGIYKVYSFDNIANKILFLNFAHAEVLTKEPNFFEN